MTALPQCVRTVYPMAQYVTEYYINEWFCDAVAKNLIPAHEALEALTLSDRACALERIGKIRLHRDWREHLDPT